MSYLKLADTLPLPFATCNSAGALTNADALPVVVIRDNGGGDMGYLPVVTNISAGRYEVTIVASGANGFVVGHRYSVWVYGNMTTVSIGVGIGWFIVKATDTDDLATTTALTAAQADITTLIGRLTAARAGYLDNLSGGAVALASALATAQADITTLLGRLTALRAGYLDNLSAGAVALASALATAQAAIDAIKASTDNLPSDPADESLIIAATNALSAAIATVQSDTADIQARLPAALTAGGKMKASMDELLAVAVAAPNVAGVPIVDTKYESGTVQPAPTVAGIPKVEDATLQARLTALRGGYLDNLNVGGNVASSAEVTAIQNDTRCELVVPEVLVVPSSSTRVYRIELLLHDDVGNMEAPDSAPTITLVNQVGTDRSARLDSTTMALVSTGRYRVLYTSTAGDATEELVWAFSVTEGGATRLYGHVSSVQQLVAGTVDANVVSIAANAITGAALADSAIAEIYEGTGAILEGSATAGDLIRGLISILGGLASGFDTDSPVFKSLDGAKTRWSGTVDATGRITITPGDLTP
jgi:hypothetical protein